MDKDVKIMSNRSSNDNQDTLQFRIPSKSDAEARERAKKRAAQSEANRNAGRQNSSAPSDNTHKKHRTSGTKHAPAGSKKTAASAESSSWKKKPEYSRSQESVPAEYSNVRVQKKKKKKKSFSPAGLLKFLAGILICLFLIYSSAALYYIGKTGTIEKTGAYINDPEKMLWSSDVKNILIIGEDARDMSSRGLSDSMILLSVNRKKHRLQMTSFMRDIYTEIDGYDSDKLNSAYQYGGAELLKDTIEDSFKIRIDGCVTVNFTAVAHIVDAVGGVEITMSADEAHAVNDILYSEVNEIMGDDEYDSFLPIADGTYLLNGKQALSYSRIRYVGDADFERTQRQRTVITRIMSGMKKISPAEFNRNILKALKYINTDMSVTDMYLLSLRLPLILGTYEPEQLRVPEDGTWYYDETWDGMSIIRTDFYANTEFLKKRLYLKDENSVPEPEQIPEPDEEPDTWDYEYEYE